MSKIEEVHTIEQSVTVALQCDSCGKRRPLPTKGWHSFSRSHGGWGNDSIDSFVYYDVCSPECFFKILAECMAAIGNYPDVEISDMPAEFVDQLLAKVAAK